MCICKHAKDSTGDIHVDFWFLFSSSQYKNEKMMKHLWHLAFKKRLIELGLFSLEKRMLRRILSMCINSWLEGMKKMEQVPLSGIH